MQETPRIAVKLKACFWHNNDGFCSKKDPLHEILPAISFEHDAGIKYVINEQFNIAPFSNEV